MKVIPFGYMGGGKFDPSRISGLVSWYKSDTNVTFTEVSGENVISSWADVDGNYPLVQAYTPAQPRLINATHGFAPDGIVGDLQNGYPYIHAPGNYFVTGLTPVLTGPFTMIFVTRYFGSNGGAYAYRYTVGGNVGIDGLPGASDSIRSHYGYKAVGGTNYTTSSDTLTIATGALTVVVADDLGWTSGYMTLQADNDNCMNGTITSYNAGTKTLVLNITSVDGSGTFSSWDVRGVTGSYNYTYYPNVTRWDTLINVYDGANSKSIVNGVDNGSGTTPTPIKHTGLKLTYCEYLEVITYNKALNTDEIAELGTYLTDKYAETTFQDRWSMYLDGIDDSITCGRVEDMEVETLTYSVWIKPGGYNRNTCILMKGSSTNRGIAFWITNTNVLVCQAGNFTNDSYFGNQVASLPTYIPVDTWGHIAFTHEQTGTGATQKIYINGILRNTYTSTTVPYTISYLGTDLYLGRRNNDTYHFIGNIDDVAVWNTALDADTITSIYNSGNPNDLTLPASYTAGSGVDKSSDLKGYWLLGDGATYNGGLALPYTIPDAWAETLYSKNYFEFDGVDDYIDCGANTSLQPTTAITLSAWFSADVLQWGKEDLISQDHPLWGSLFKGYNIGCYIGTNNTLNYYFGLGDGSSETQVTDTNVTVGPYPYAINTWYHLCGTWDGSTMTVYINGISLGTTAFSGPISYDATQNTYIGRRGHGQAYYWDGGIDDVAIWNTGKSASEVLAIYNSGKPSDLSAESGLVGYWTFDDATISGQWTVPDNSANSNNGTSNAMGPDNKKSYGNEAKLTNGSMVNAKMNTP